MNYDNTYITIFLEDDFNIFLDLTIDKDIIISIDFFKNKISYDNNIKISVPYSDVTYDILMYKCGYITNYSMLPFSEHFVKKYICCDFLGIAFSWMNYFFMSDHIFPLLVEQWKIDKKKNILNLIIKNIPKNYNISLLSEELLFPDINLSTKKIIEEKNEILSMINHSENINLSTSEIIEENYEIFPMINYSENINLSTSEIIEEIKVISPIICPEKNETLLMINNSENKNFIMENYLINVKLLKKMSKICINIKELKKLHSFFNLNYGKNKMLHIFCFCMKNSIGGNLIYQNNITKSVLISNCNLFIQACFFINYKIFKHTNKKQLIFEKLKFFFKKNQWKTTLRFKADLKLLYSNKINQLINKYKFLTEEEKNFFLDMMHKYY